MPKETKIAITLSGIGAIFIILLIMWGVGSIKASRAEVVKAQSDREKFEAKQRWDADAPKREAKERRIQLEYEEKATKRIVEAKRQQERERKQKIANRVVEHTVLKKWKPNQHYNGLGLDLLVSKDVNEHNLNVLIKHLSGNHDPILIRIWTSRIAYNDDDAVTPEFKSDYILFYVKNLTGSGAFRGYNEIRWFQSVGKFKDIPTTKF